MDVTRELDRNGLEILDRADCLALLTTVAIGRVGISSEALPAVLPVNFALDADQIVVRTAAGTKLSAALDHAIVAFEADRFDPINHTGWSVLVRGEANEIRNEGALRRVRRLPLRPWANEEADHYVAIATELVTGRRIQRWLTDAHGELPTTLTVRR